MITTEIIVSFEGRSITTTMRSVPEKIIRLKDGQMVEYFREQMPEAVSLSCVIIRDGVEVIKYLRA